MAVMDALLKIKAAVSGEDQVTAMGRAIGGLTSAAGKVSGGLKGTLSAVGGLSSAMGNLVPLVSGAGLVGLGKGAIDAADDMNDLAQKTGVSVEQLSRFKQAADASGTDIDSVGAAMIKYGKNAASTGKANEKVVAALDELGVSSKDAAGNLKSSDQVMLEVADRFKSMPDGANKSRIAIDLFGKAGANLVPLLNGGSEAVKSLTATMTTPFAKASDAFNDKLVSIQGKLGQVGASVGTALLPALNLLSDVVIGLANGFTALPGPIQALIGVVAAVGAAFVVLAPAITAIITLGSALGGLSIGATIAGWLGAIGPAIAGITAVITGFLAWLTGTLLPGLIAFFSGPVGWTVLAVAAVVAMVVLFKKPIGDFLKWLGGAIATGLKALWQWSEPIRTWLAGVLTTAMEAIKAAWTTISGVVSWGVKAAWAIIWQLFIQPWINAWNVVLRKPVTALWEWLKGIWAGISNFWSKNVVAPISGAWNALSNGIRDAMQKAVSFVSGIWTGLIKTLRGLFNGYLAGWANAINSVIRGVNSLIATFNRLPGPDIGYIPTVGVPAFAEGGVVDRPTLAVVGEGGEREYIIPESKMARASAAFLGGARGSQVMGPGTINITTGPVLQQQGQQWVTMADLERAMRATEASTLGRIRTPAGRAALGIR